MKNVTGIIIVYNFNNIIHGTEDTDHGINNNSTNFLITAHYYF